MNRPSKFFLSFFRMRRSSHGKMSLFIGMLICFDEELLCVSNKQHVSNFFRVFFSVMTCQWIFKFAAQANIWMKTTSPERPFSIPAACCRCAMSFAQTLNPSSKGPSNSEAGQARKNCRFRFCQHDACSEPFCTNHKAA